MELNGERLIPASIDATWAALNDPETLKACIAGCESLERIGDDGFVAVVAMKIGPVSARFKGNLKLTNVQAPTGYTINFDGQGGVAGFGKGSADVSLTPVGASCDEARLRCSRDRRRQDGADRLAPDRRDRGARSPTTSSRPSRRSCTAKQRRRRECVDGPRAHRLSVRREPAGVTGWVLAVIVALATIYLILR